MHLQYREGRTEYILAVEVGAGGERQCMSTTSTQHQRRERAPPLASATSTGVGSGRRTRREGLEVHTTRNEDRTARDGRAATARRSSSLNGGMVDAVTTQTTLEAGDTFGSGETLWTTRRSWGGYLGRSAAH
jgi:hypothetical protein